MGISILKSYSLSLGLLLPLCAGLSVAQTPVPFFHAHDVILFQGDSITDGGRQRTGLDYNHIMGQDYAYILSAEIGAEHPELDLNFINRGISGNTVLDLAARWQQDTLGNKPNFLSILIGINDTIHAGDRAETVEQFRDTYDKLLATTIAALPNTKIVLGEPFLLSVGKYKDSYATMLAQVKLRQAVVFELGVKYHLPVVRYQDALNQECKTSPADHWSWDGIHPTYAGHGLMVQEWLKTVAAWWPNG
jgi:lysophospholipase L1-like esterase